MRIICPNCKKRFELDPAGAEAGKKFRCSHCRAVFRLVPRGGGEHRTIKVVIANESLPFCEAVRKVLEHEPFEIFICCDGKVALETVERVRPELLLLDVALPTMLGFEVCERVRQNPQLFAVKIVLIASIYDKTRYKRAPVSLYGADDYIEKHHIPDALVPMIYRLASGSTSVGHRSDPGESAEQEQSRGEIRSLEVSETSPAKGADPGPAPPASFVPEEPDEAESKARRLARIIVSDIALYHQGKVEQGVREGTLRELLKEEIREGELLYSQRVPRELRERTAYLAEAFEDLITKKRAQMRL